METHEPILEERKTVDWLARATRARTDEVASALDVGERRRAFVVDELLDAGLTGNELLDAVMRLTGLDERGARRAIREHTS